MQTVCQNMNHAALRSVKVARPFVHQSQPRSRRAAAYLQSISVRAHAANDGPQDTHWLPTRRALGAVLAAGIALSAVDAAAAAGLRMKGMPGGSGANDELSEKYINSVEKKKRQSLQRKEALQKRRAEALKSGATAQDKEAAPEIQAANAEVDRSNAERAADSEKLMQGIRSRAAQYDSTSNKKPGLVQ